ncbi:MAG: hypothetical protein R3F13_11785 [Prosthecobacter sp.]
MTWSEAFLRQAASDFEVHEFLSRQVHLPRCHGLHYLQMAVEKLVKSFLCHGSGGPPRESHAVVTGFIRSCASNRKLRDRFKMENQPFSSMLRKLTRVAEYIEKLAPAMSDSVNSEYPWETASGGVLAPRDHAFEEVPASEMAQFKYFVAELLRIQMAGGF